MKAKVLQNVFIVAVAVFVITTLVALFIEYRYVSREQEKEFREQAEYMSNLIEKSGTDVLSAVSSTEKIRLRVTVIAADGRVEYDSQEIAASLPNHAEHEEVAEALARATASATPRRSGAQPTTTPCAWRTGGFCACPRSASRCGS